MDLRERVRTAMHEYTRLKSLEALEASGVRAGDSAAAPASAAVAYPLGWIVASAIVAARYADSAIDAIPVYHPEQGWDRFLLTRRVTCLRLADESADVFGQLVLAGDDAPRLVRGDAQLSLGRLLRDDPEGAIARVLELLPPVGLVAGDHSWCRHERARLYPTLFDVVTELVVEHPGVVPAREIFVDDQQIGGTYHPLYVHSVAVTPQLVYDWFGLETARYSAFFHITGEQALYETDMGGWSAVQRQLAGEDRAGIRRRLLAWLRIEGEPDPRTVD